MPEAGARLTLYTALAGLLSPPSEEMLRAAASREFAEALHAVIPSLPGDSAVGLAECVDTVQAEARARPLRELEVEYARLFLGPGQPIAPPWESAWITEAMEGQGLVPVRVVESVSAAYTDGGFRLEPGSEPADYLGAELEYLILLAEARDGRSAALHDRFIAEHFAVWVPQLAAAAEREAALPFYRATARLLAAACA